MARPSIEVVHVGSASRDIAPDDPRGWRLGGGVTYAALATARLGIATAAVIGVDAAASRAHELDALHAAGVDVLAIELAEGPVFHNLETPAGRRQTAIAVGTPLEPVAVPDSWRRARGWSFTPRGCWKVVCVARGRRCRSAPVDVGRSVRELQPSG